MRRISEKLFVIVLLLISMYVVSGLLNSSDVNTETSNAIVSTGVHLPVVIAEMAMYIWCALLVLPRWKVTLRAVGRAWPILLLPALAIASSAWSVNPLLTLRRSSFFTLTTIMAIHLGERFEPDEFAKLFAQAQCVLIFGSIAMYFVLPGKVIDPSHFGAWKGLTIHKNVFGECMGVAVLLLTLVRFKRHRVVQALFWAASIVLLYLAHSITATAACGVVFLAIPVVRRISRLRIQERVFAYSAWGALTVLAVFLAVNDSDTVLAMLGKDSTLSGRALLWQLVMDSIWQRPLLGYGYEAFWEGFQGASRGILQSTGWLVPMAHNGYLDLWLSIGLVGLAVYLGIFLYSMRMALHYLRAYRPAVAAWPVAYLCFFALHNTAESTLLTRTTFEFLVFVQVFVALQQFELRERAVQWQEEEYDESGAQQRPMARPELGPSGATT